MVNNPDTVRERALREAQENERGKATAIYVVYLVALFTALPFLIGVVMAYVFRNDTIGFLRSHYDKQIGLFWWFLLWQVVGWSTSWLLGLGLIVVGISWVWMLIRCVQGVMRAQEGRPWA